MKTKNIYLMITLAFFANVVMAQDVEFDDMYFTKKDRAKLVAAREKEEKAYKNSAVFSKTEEPEEDVNPTDTYSARNVNPEYTSRANSQVAQADNEDYFVNNYRYTKQNQFNNWSNNYNNWYNNPWYSSAYFGPSINSWNTPYYGSYYDTFSNPWYNPYYQSGWSSSFSYSWGNNWNYGWGMNYGYGNPYSYWNSPWYSPFYSSWYSPFNSWYSPYGRGWYGYPTTIIVVENNGRGPVYGKRASRGTSFVPTGDNRSRNVISNNRNTNNGGRINTRQEEYYQRTYQPAGRTSTGTQDSRNTTQYNRSRTWSNDNSSWSNSSGRSSSPSMGSGTRSHSSGSGSGTNGRTRGRD